MPYFDYCSTIVTSLNSISLVAENKNIIKLTKCFNNNLKIFTHIDLFTSENNLDKQINLLKNSKILPFETQTFSKIFLFHSKTFC